MSEDNPLGQTTAYPEHYDPDLLYPLARAQTRRPLGLPEATLVANRLPFYGTDWWTAYEVSWLDALGKPQVALAQFAIPCTSPYLVESKSFKLYLNSFNQSEFGGIEEVKEYLKTDLARALGADLEVRLTALADARLPIETPRGLCLDSLPVRVDRYSPEPDYLSAGSVRVEERLYSHLLKTNCPVTGQPDWATLEIAYRGPRIDHEGLLRYIISFRNHQDFHEHCVERIYLDMMTRCRPDYLSLFARYTRRGGLDINPFRCSEPGQTPEFERLLRQ